MKKYLIYSLLLLFVVAFGACRQRSPEKLPKLKKKFKAQIETFEKQKEKANKHVNQGLEKLTALQEAINNARNVDKEFNRVYGAWEKVDKRVNNLYEEYGDLRGRADSLFAALDRQIESLNDAKNKKDLKNALKKSRREYDKTLVDTEKAIDKLRNLHAEAVDIIKALEAAVAIGQIAEFNEGLKSIRDRVDDIMAELSITVEESKSLYDNKMGSM